jgi:hypothetical protein
MGLEATHAGSAANAEAMRSFGASLQAFLAVTMVARTCCEALGDGGRDRRVDGGLDEVGHFRRLRDVDRVAARHLDHGRTRPG